MKKECTEQDLRELARSAQAVFEAVTLTEAPLCDGWQDDGLRVDYELRNGRVDCVLHRRVEADGKCWELEMCAPLAGNVLPEERMTPRERELCREDMSHDFLTGVYNRRYLETCVGDLIALGSGGKRSGEEQLCALGHDADVCVGSAQSTGATADTQNNGHLRNNTGDLCDLCIQLCAGGQHVQTLGQLCANRVIEGDHRAAGLCSHFLPQCFFLKYHLPIFHL